MLSSFDKNQLQYDFGLYKSAIMPKFRVKYLDLFLLIL